MKRFASRALIGCAAAALLLGAACSDDEGGTKVAERTSTTTAVSPARSARVELVSAGAEPRVALRFTPKTGTEQKVRLRTDQRQQVKVGGASQDVDSPATEFDLRYRVTSTANDRIAADVLYEAGRVVADADADAAVVEQLEEVVDAFKGKSGKFESDARGRIITFGPPDIDLEGQLGDLMDQFRSGFSDQASALAVPFPEEAVGVGAKWRVTSTAKIAGLPLTSVTEVTLTELRGQDVAGRVTQTITFIPGATEIAGTPARVVSGQLKGAGTVRWDLSLVTSLLEQTIDGPAIIEVGSGDNAQRVEQTQHQVITITAR